jgi:hypothetical protein
MYVIGRRQAKTGIPGHVEAFGSDAEAVVFAGTGGDSVWIRTPQSHERACFARVQLRRFLFGGSRPARGTQLSAVFPTSRFFTPLVFGLLENFPYRQLVLSLRLQGVVKYLA